MKIWKVSQLGSASERLRSASLQLCSHLEAGADGRAPWCSWVGPAREADKLWFAELEYGEQACEPFGRAVNEVASAFLLGLNSLRTTGEDYDCRLRALTVLLLFAFDHEEAEEQLQSERPALLARGLMAGLLGPQSSLMTLKERVSGRPYRTYHRFLTIRCAVPQDAFFLAQNPRLRGLLDAYLRAVPTDAGD